MEEFARRVETKPYLRERISRDVLEDFVQLLVEVAEIIPPLSQAIPALTRDPKDDYLLAYALLGQADYLVAGDDDLLSLGSVGGLQIVTARELLARL